MLHIRQQSETDSRKCGIDKINLNSSEVNIDPKSPDSNFDPDFDSTPDSPFVPLAVAAVAGAVPGSVLTLTAEDSDDDDGDGDFSFALPVETERRRGTTV